MEGSRWECGCLGERAEAGAGSARGAAAGARAPGFGAGIAGRGEGGGAGRAAGGSRARSDRAGPRGARRRALGAEGVCGRGLGGRPGFLQPAEGRGVRGAPCLAERGWSAPLAPLKFRRLRRTEFPGRKSVLAKSGICWSRLVFLPLAADPSPWRRLENFFWRLAASKRLGAAAASAPGGAVVVGRVQWELGWLQRPAGAGLSGGALGAVVRKGIC